MTLASHIGMASDVFMQHSSRQHIQVTTEMCADIVDALSDSLDDDSLHTLISVFMELSGLPHGSAFTTDIATTIEHALSLSQSANTTTSSKFTSPHPLAFRAMQTLQTEFAVTSSSKGLQYDYAFPLRVHGQALGAVTLKGTHSQLLNEHTVSSLQSIADIAATSINQTRLLQQHKVLVQQLQNALNSRVVLEQAKGVLAERLKTDFPTAFAELRSRARSAQRPIHHVAEDIVCSVMESSLTAAS